jgi:hypothetical protein
VPVAQPTPLVMTAAPDPVAMCREQVAALEGLVAGRREELARVQVELARVLERLERARARLVALEGDDEPTEAEARAAAIAIEVAAVLAGSGETTAAGRGGTLNPANPPSMDLAAVYGYEAGLAAGRRELAAENERLRAALEVFADKANWAPMSKGFVTQVWVRGEEEPWTIAQTALSPKEPTE